MPDEPENVEYPSDWTIVLSGPEAQRLVVLAGLDRAGADVNDQPISDPSHGLEETRDPTVGWVTCRHGDVDEIVRPANGDDPGGIATRAGWVHRMHWPTPTCGVCGGRKELAGVVCLHCGGKGKTNTPPPQRNLLDELDALRAEVAALKARG